MRSGRCNEVRTGEPYKLHLRNPLTAQMPHSLITSLAHSQRMNVGGTPMCGAREEHFQPSESPCAGAARGGGAEVQACAVP